MEGKGRGGKAKEVLLGLFPWDLGLFHGASGLEGEYGESELQEEADDGEGYAGPHDDGDNFLPHGEYNRTGANGYGATGALRCAALLLGRARVAIVVAFAVDPSAVVALVLHADLVDCVRCDFVELDIKHDHKDRTDEVNNGGDEGQNRGSLERATGARARLLAGAADD